MTRLAITALLLGACSVTYPADRPITLDVRDQQRWLVDVADDAAVFWRARGVDVTLAIGAGDVPVRVGDVDEGSWARYRIAGPGAGAIYAPARLQAAIAPGCVIAHELGHAFGMEHVSEVGDLMSEKATLTDDRGCPFTDRDAAELCRVGGPCDTAP